ncbi:MAG: MFS transporter [Legionella sp.]|nr:MFS transporter [Legionella sp.]
MRPITLIALCLGFFMVIMDVTIVNVALPTLGAQLHASVSWLQWIVDGYTLSFAALLLTTGHLSDQFNAKKLFRSGIILFALTSLFCGLVSVPWLLTSFRIVQGIAAALVVPTSLALIHMGVTEKKAHSKAIAIWAATGGIAAAVGPVIGAVLTSSLGWRAVFFVNVPIAITCWWLTKNGIKVKVPNDHKKSFDWPGQIFAIFSIATLALAIIEAGHLGWKDPLVIGNFVVFFLSTVMFVISEWYGKTPMLPLTFFKIPSFRISILAGLLLNLGVYGEFFILPLYFQHLRHYSVLATGLALTPLTIIMPLSSYLSGKLINHLGDSKWPALLGLVIATIGYSGLLIAGEQTPAYYYFILPLLLLGFGVSMSMPALTILLMHSVPSNAAGLASGAFNMSRQLGSLLGVAIFGSMIASTSNFIVGMHLTLYFGITTYLFAVFLIGNLLRKKTPYLISDTLERPDTLGLTKVN